MVMNLFSMFDSNIKSFQMNLLIMLIMPKKMIYKNFWLTKNMMTHLFILLLKEYKEKNSKTMMIIFSTILIIMVNSNLLNIVPMMMAPTTNLTMNLSMMMTLWMNSTMMLLNNKNNLMMSMSPKNTPVMMMPLINIIELNSFFFQIISLSMRLTVNMMMGHLIISMIKIKIFLIMFMMVEVMIIIIQSYIFLSLNLLNFKNSM